MPRAVQYNPGSIVYFKGDKSKYVYVLKEGKISLSYEDVHNGQEIIELVKLGDFFGIQDSLGGYKHDETATTIEPSVVIQFGLEEFEGFIQNKPDLLIKMLKIYSRRLRVIHAEVQNLISSQKVIFPEEGMMKVGEYYFNNRFYDKAGDIFERYLKYYPNGAYKDLVTDRLESSRHYEEKPAAQSPVQPSQRMGPIRNTSMHGNHGGSNFQQGVDYYRKGNYEKALGVFLNVIKVQDSAHIVDAEFYVGSCLFYLNKFSDSIKQFSSLLRKQPKHPDLGEILFFLGESNGKLENLDKAVAFLRKAISLLSPDTKLYNEAEKSLKEYQRRGGIQ